MRNLTADGVGVNSPPQGDNLSQYYPPFSVASLTIENNIILYTNTYPLPASGWHAGVDISFGWCMSFSGTWLVTVSGNTCRYNGWQTLHFENNCHFSTVSNNILDSPVPNGAYGWTGLNPNVWIQGSYQTYITGNTLIGAPDSAIMLGPAPSVFCDADTGPGASVACLPVPASEWYTQYITITGNNFVSWGLSGTSQTYAIKIGGQSFQYNRVSISGNTYNDVWSNYNEPNVGLSDANKFIWCNCVGDPTIVISETNVPIRSSANAQPTPQSLTTCNGYQYGASTCTFTNVASVNPVAWWTVLALPPPQPEQQPSVSASSTFGTVSASVSSWTDIAGSNYVLSSSASTPPVYTPGINAAAGFPGLLFANNGGQQRLSTSASIWPTNSDYSLVVALVVYDSTVNGVVIGSPSGGHSLAISGGSYVLSHGGASVTGFKVTTNVANLVTVTYRQSSGAVTFSYYNIQCATGTLGASNSDSGVSVGGGFYGMVYDVQIFGHVLSTNDIYNLAYEAVEYSYCSAFYTYFYGSCDNPSYTMYVTSCPTGP